MKITRIVLSLIVLSILWCADVFAHGNPEAHFESGRPRAILAWVGDSLMRRLKADTSI